MPSPGEIPDTGNGLGDIQQIMSIFQGIFGTGSTTSTDSNSPIAISGIEQLLGPLLQQFQAGDYSPEAATRDSQGDVQDIINQLKEQGIPLIAGQQNAAGAYGGTTASLLANDLASRAAGQAAQVTAKTKQQYAGIKNSQAMSIIALINSAVQAQRNQTTANKTDPLKDNVAARNTALGALLASLLGKDNKQNKNPSGSQSQNNKKDPTAGAGRSANSPSGNPLGPSGDKETEGSPDSGTGGNAARGPDGDAADRAAQDELTPNPFTDLAGGATEPGGILDPDTIDLGDFGNLTTDLPGLPDFDPDLLFFGDDDQGGGTDFDLITDLGDIGDYPTDDFGNTDDIGDPGDGGDSGYIDD